MCMLQKGVNHIKSMVHQLSLEDIRRHENIEKLFDVLSSAIGSRGPDAASVANEAAAMERNVRQSESLICQQGLACAALDAGIKSSCSAQVQIPEEFAAMLERSWLEVSSLVQTIRQLNGLSADAALQDAVATGGIAHATVPGCRFDDMGHPLVTATRAVSCSATNVADKVEEIKMR